MNYIILDMEWNMQKVGTGPIRTPRYLAGEIIQIGAVKTDEKLAVIDTFDVMIKPKHYTVMNKYVQEITQITTEMLAHGIDFKVAIEQFKDWCGENSILFTWGPSDGDMLYNNLDFYEMDNSWVPEEYDAQLLFDDIVTQEDRTFSLDYARYHFGIKGLDAHNALNDAVNTHEVMVQIGADEVATWLEEEMEYRAQCDAEDAQDGEIDE